MNPEENIQAPVASAAPVKLGKFKASRMIVGESWRILNQDKGLMWFPVLSAIVSLLALIIMAAVFFLIVMRGDIHAFAGIEQTGADIIGYVSLFVYYLVMFVITNYFLAGMYTVIHSRFNGQSISFNEGIGNANKNLGKIFAWSLISATVGLILQILEDKLQFIGKIITWLFGAAWAILTYFSLPSLIIGQTSVRNSFKESASLIRKTWGEAIIVNFGVGLFFALLTFVVFTLAIGLLVLVPIKIMLVLVITLMVIYVVVITILSSTLSSIFKLALYEYARTGIVPQGFTSALIQGAVRAKK